MTDRDILLIEDDPDLSRLAAMHLEDYGYRVQVERDGTRGCRRAKEESYDLVIVDLMLPGTDGLEICRQVRNSEQYTPLLIVTARAAEADRVLGLEMGADDYLSKPVSLRELAARVRAIFRRVDALRSDASACAAPEHLSLGELSVHLPSRSVELGGEPVDLTAREYDLLLHLALHPNRVFTRGELVESIWGPGYEGYEHTVNSHINRLRNKISRGGSRQRFIRTVWGVGYRFAADLAT